MAAFLDFIRARPIRVRLAPGDPRLGQTGHSPLIAPS
jgi:hypothetical protein